MMCITYYPVMFMLLFDFGSCNDDITDRTRFNLSLSVSFSITRTHTHTQTHKKKEHGALEKCMHVI